MKEILGKKQIHMILGSPLFQQSTEKLPTILDDDSIKETKERCTHCYGTGKDHGDVSMRTDCPGCDGRGFIIIKGGNVNP